MSGPMIPIHPMPGGDARTVRWRTPARTLPVVGPPRTVPPSLAALYADGTVAHTAVGEDYLDVTLTEDRSWREEGARLRAAILDALARPELWEVAEEPAVPDEDGVSADAWLYDAAVAALAGEVGELARSHGGAIELESVEDGVVTVRMRGACNGCPAAEVTLHARLERQLRESCPQIREVRSAGVRGTLAAGLPWPRFARRRPDRDS